jgi:hypothetical protein
MRAGGAIRQAGRAVRTHADVLLLGVLICAITWPEKDLEPFEGIDGAWQVALHVAAATGLDYGREIVYTFGPLGFLQAPTWVDPLTVRLAFAYEFALHLLLCVSLVAALRPTFRLLPAAALALLIAGAVGGVQVHTIGFIWLAALLLVPMDRAPTQLLAVGLGVLTGLELLGKLNSGLVLLGMVVVAVVVLPPERRRTVALPFGIATAAAAALGWLLTGQSITAIPGYLSGSASLISGYSQAMLLESPGRGWQLWLVPVLTGIGLIAALDGRRRPERARIGLAAAWLILAFTSFKEGFVRHEDGHASFFFVSMLGGFVAFAMVPRPRGTALLVGLVAFTAVGASLSSDPGNWIRPAPRLAALAEQVATLSDGSETNAEIAAAREKVASFAPLDEQTLAAVQGHDVHVAATLAYTAWAYRLRWHPLPVFQTYAAYLEALDRRDADVMAARDGPERILRHFEPGIDGRRLIWDDPHTIRAMLCNFRAISTTALWQVLARADADRCGEPRLIEEVETSYGVTTRVPASRAGEAVYVEVEGVQVGGVERLRSLLYRAYERRVIVNGVENNRLVPGTAAGGLLLQVPPAGDFPAPFSLNAGVRTIAFTRSDGTTGGDITLRFHALPVQR